MIKNNNTSVNLAIFASGTGSNALNICRYFEGREDVKVCLIASNKRDAPIVEKASEMGCPVLVFSKKDLYESDAVLSALKKSEIDIIILAGFLWLIPSSLVVAFPAAIINIHPSLLPKYGGKGMYGDRVHEAVLQSGDSESGITIHTIDEEYDKGNILIQARCKVEAHDDISMLRSKVQILEHAFFPTAIEAYIALHFKTH